MQERKRIRIGISGWTYAPWRGKFYPEGLPHKQELAYAAGVFSSIEVNGTFYGMQKPATFRRWAQEVPDDFVFAIKAPRYITHIRRLRDIEAPLSNFLASGILELGEKLGPILWQFPPSFQYERERMENFLRLLPSDFSEAMKLARKAEPPFRHPLTKPAKNLALRHAIEIRHESFAVPEFIDLLRKDNVALVCADTVEWPLLMDVTANFVYCRLHGSEKLYASGYDGKALDRWARRVLTWMKGGEPRRGRRASPKKPRHCAHRDVFVYFDNSMKICAPRDAQSLQDKIRKKA